MDVLFYDGVHSIIFGNKHSWLDWHLVPLSKPIIPPPELVENYVDIPGANGQLDLTDVINGFPTYKNRSGEFSFVIDPAYGYLESVYNEIANLIHGQRMRVILTDDPDWCYEGRVVISAAESGKDYSTIAFKGVFDPFKLTVNPLPGLEDIEVNNSKIVDISIGTSPMREVPKITSTSSMTAELNGVTTNIVEGSYRYPGLLLGPGINSITFTGTGIISIEARGGSL